MAKTITYIKRRHWPLVIRQNVIRYITTRCPDDSYEPNLSISPKPTGQGTGLGLSYDIVKAHEGELKVETKYIEGLPTEVLAQAGTTFIIQLPII